VQLAFRAETGYILPYGGKRPAVPFNIKFYLGGADTVRGWRQRRLSPKTLSFAAKLNDTPLSKSEDAWTFHPGLGETF
jgi:outer membrane protein assembly factor BamA